MELRSEPGPVRVLAAVAVLFMVEAGLYARASMFTTEGRGLVGTLPAAWNPSRAPRMRGLLALGGAASALKLAADGRTQALARLETDGKGNR